MTMGVRKTNLVEYSLPDWKGERIALNQVNSEKDIEVIIDSNLTFREHMTEMVSKANRVMGVIRRTYTYLDESTFLSLYKALVRPLVEYANQVWAPHSVKDIEIIKSVERRATKCIPGLVGMEYPERLRSLKLLTLAYRRLRGDMKPSKYSKENMIPNCRLNWKRKTSQTFTILEGIP